MRRAFPKELYHQLGNAESVLSLLVQDVADRLPNLGSKGAYLKQQMEDKLIQHKHFIYAHGKDMPEIQNWKWSVPK